MYAFLEFRVSLIFLCLFFVTVQVTANLLFLGRDPISTQNKGNAIDIPAVARLLRGFSLQKVSGVISAKNRNTGYSLRTAKLPLHSIKNLHNRKKKEHDMARQLLETNTAKSSAGNDSRGSSYFRLDGRDKSGSFQISDESVSGTGTYSISHDRKDIDLMLKIKIRHHQEQELLKQKQQPKQQQRQKQQQQKNKQKLERQKQQQTKTTPKPVFLAPAPLKICLAPCNVRHMSKALYCLAIASGFEKEALDLHNRYRLMHNAPPMTLNCEMSWNAAAYAQKLADMGSGLVQSSYYERPYQGENLAFGCTENRELTAEEAIKMWFDEVCKYDFSKSGPQPGTGDFSQLIRKGTTEFGIGKASKKQSSGTICTFIVARYRPQGNLHIGDSGYNKNIEKGWFDKNYCQNIKKASLNRGHDLKRFETMQTDSFLSSIRSN